jgi:hypothetical protein
MTATPKDKAHNSVNDRAFNDPGTPTVHAADWTMSPAATRVLREQGVEAWQAWVAQRSASGPS